MASKLFTYYSSVSQSVTFTFTGKSKERERANGVRKAAAAALVEAKLLVWSSASHLIRQAPTVRFFPYILLAGEERAQTETGIG